MSERFPPVVWMAIHKENEQTVFFRDEAQARQKVVSDSPPTSTLTEDFQLCSINAVGLNGVKARDVL